MLNNPIKRESYAPTARQYLDSIIAYREHKRALSVAANVCFGSRRLILKNLR